MNAIVPSLALAGLRGRDRKGMAGVAVRGVVTSVEGPGGRDTTTWAYTSDPIVARINPVSERTRVRAEAPAAVGDWVLALPSNAVVRPGERWRFSGRVRGKAVERTLSVVWVPSPKMPAVRTRAFCIDVEANA